MNMTNKTYDTLRLIALIAVPATTCIVAILSALGYAHTDVVAAILAAIDTFLGALVEIVRREYNKRMEG